MQIIFRDSERKKRFIQFGNLISTELYTTPTINYSLSKRLHCFAVCVCECMCFSTYRIIYLTIFFPNINTNFKRFIIWISQRIQRMSVGGWPIGKVRHNTLCIVPYQIRFQIAIASHQVKSFINDANHYYYGVYMVYESVWVVWVPWLH